MGAIGCDVSVLVGLTYGLFVVVSSCDGIPSLPLCSPSIDTLSSLVLSPTDRRDLDLGLLVVRGSHCSHKIKRKPRVNP